MTTPEARSKALHHTQCPIRKAGHRRGQGRGVSLLLLLFFWGGAVVDLGVCFCLFWWGAGGWWLTYIYWCNLITY